MSNSQCAVAALLVALVVGVQGHQIIYVDTENGTLNNSCWEGGLDQPCGTLELADTGAQRYNSTVAVVWKYGSSRNTPTTAPNTPQALSCPHLPTTDNGTYGYKPTVSRCNESTNIQKCSSVSAQSSNVGCPPWFESTNDTCKCGESINGVVKCNEMLQKSFILDCYCMTYDESTGTVVGACFYNCVTVKNALKDVVYRVMPKEVKELNDAMCGGFNRSGQLCGECKANHTPLVYSYDLQCTMCSGGLYNWVSYVAIAFVPLTIFLVLVLCCRISATSPQLYTFVTYSQIFATPVSVRILLVAVNKHPRTSLLIRIVSALYGFWNLDFFRTLIPHKICLKVDTLQALALDYCTAFYPLSLIIVTYVLIELHDHNFRVIVWIWRPFHRYFARFRQQWNIRTSIIDAFATFLLLSNVKLLSVSFDLLIPTRVYSTNGSVVGIYLYYDASIEYFGKKHLPYAILAVLVVLIFIIFPILLLLLYPMRCFQWCLGRCKVRWHALHIFIDAFQGYYKDGTDGTRDCRYFAGLYLLMRLLFAILFAITLSVAYYGLAILVLISVAMLIAIFQPYKAEFSTYNAVDSVFILVLAMWYGTAVFYYTAVIKASYLVKASVIVSSLIGTLPLLYIVVIFVRWICSHNKIGQRLVRKLKSQIRKTCRRTHGTGLEESLPNRLIDRCHYDNSEGDFSMTNSFDFFGDHTYAIIH